MSDIELVIKIPKEVYETLRKTYVILGGQRQRGGETPMSVIYNAVVNSTPLPKGHGRLIDADKLHHCECKGNFSECDTCLDDDLCNLVNEAPTIIEADTESEVKNGKFKD